ncbi:tape measure protein [Xanthobacter autotrophicus]|uniref:tape measure protein n=1 Tax=Xanthobacter autotrophicus TaxID=280 RepID=UPI003728AFA0
MAENDGKLELGFNVDNSTLQRGFKRSQQVADQSLGEIERRAERAKGRIERSMGEASSKAGKSLADLGRGDTFAALGGRLGGIVAAAFSGRELLRYADAWTGVQNALKVAGLSGKDLTSALDQLYAAAQRQGAPLSALVTLYGRASQSAKELGATREELIQFSEDVATALRVAGTSPEEASGALLQLSQLLGSARVQAEEFNSINDGARPILQAVARGIDEAAGSVSKLKALVTEGKISNTAFFRGFQAGVGELRDQAATAEPTISQATEKVKNAIMRMVGEVDKSAGFSRGLVSELESMSQGFEKASEPIKEVIALLQKLADLYNYVSANGLNLGKKFNQAIFGTDTVEDFVFPPTPKTTGGIGSDPDRNMRTAAPPKPIKAADYPVIGGKTKGGGSDGLDEYERAIRSIQEHTRLTEAETAVVGKSTYEMERARDVQKLLNAAKQAGLEITPELTAQIEKEANAHAQATQKLADAEHKTQQIHDLQQAVGDQAVDSIHGLITGAKTLNDVLADVLDNLVKLALQGALLGQGPLAGILGGGTGGGIVGSLFGGARAGGGDVASGKSYLVGEKGPELFSPGRSGTIVPHDVLANIRAPMVNIQPAQPAPSINFAPTVNVNANGGTHAQNADLGKQVTREMQRMVRDTIIEEIRRQRRPNGALA